MHSKSVNKTDLLLNLSNLLKLNEIENFEEESQIMMLTQAIKRSLLMLSLIK